MEVGALEAIAAIAASAGALARVTRIRRIHVLGIPLLLLGWAGLLATILPDSLATHRAVVVLGFLGAAGLALFLARVLDCAVRWLLVAGAIVLTIRVPVPTGDGNAMLLGPLYVVIGLIACIVLLRELRELRAGERLLPDRGGATRLVDVGAAVLPATATLSLMWSFDPPATTEALAFFLVPFVLLYACLRTLASAREDLKPAAWALVASGVVVALVGLFQKAVGEVWWNPKVIDANRFRADFRTNSLYWDPNMYGRALVIAILAVVAWLLVRRVSRRGTPLLAGVLLVLVAALWFTYSQSSWVALAAGLTIVAVLTLPPNPRRWVAGALLLLVLVGTPAAARHLAGDDASGRRDVINTGISLAAERPVLGWGIGTFEAAARARELERGNADPGLVASHTTPITVFAELGLLGAFTYLTLLTSAVVTMLARWRRTSTPAAAARARGDFDDAGTGWPIAPVIWASGALFALIAHSLLYAGFFEDPTLWVVLAVLASLPNVIDDEVVESDESALASPALRSPQRL
ncbi:MAG: O-antigen polymerase [Thermoleophilia bacterium]|nr:O-antigen polymerase [Thermoleophilia bacterium]